MKEYVLLGEKVFIAKVPMTVDVIDRIEEVYKAQYVGPLKKTLHGEEVKMYVFKVKK